MLYHADMVAILRDDATALSTPEKWTGEFTGWMESLEVHPSSGRPVIATIKENIQNAQQMGMDGRRLTVIKRDNAISICRERDTNIRHGKGFCVMAAMSSDTWSKEQQAEHIMEKYVIV